MNYKIMFMLNALVAALFGLVLVRSRQGAGSVWNNERYASTLLVGRSSGQPCSLSARGVVRKRRYRCGCAKGHGYRFARWRSRGLIVTLIGTFASNAVIRSNGWIAMVLYVLFGLGYAYLVFLQRQSSNGEGPS
jgi:hypothetical protein